MNSTFLNCLKFENIYLGDIQFFWICKKTIDYIYCKTTSRCIIIIGVFLQIKAHYVLRNIAVVFILFVVVRMVTYLGKWELDLKKYSV